MTIQWSDLLAASAVANGDRRRAISELECLRGEVPAFNAAIMACSSAYHDGCRLLIVPKRGGRHDLYRVDAL